MRSKRNIINPPLILAVLWWLCLACACSYAQSMKLKPWLQHFSAADYWGHPENHNVLQDQLGRIWIGNGNRIAYYNGEKWTDPHAQTEMHYHAYIAMDPNGKIWFGESDRLGYLTTNAQGKIEAVDITDSLPIAGRIFDVHRVYSDKHTLIFDLNGGVLFLDSQTQRSLFYLEDDEHHRYRAFHGDGRTWIYDKVQSVIFPFNLASGAGKSIPVEPALGEIVPLSGNRLLLTYPHAAYIYDLEQKKHQPLRLPVVPHARQNPIIYANTLFDDLIGISVKNVGLIITNTQGQVVEVFDSSSGLVDLNISHFFLDRETNLWLSTLNGVTKISLGLPFRKMLLGTELSARVQSLKHYSSHWFIGTTNGLWAYKNGILNQLTQLPFFVEDLVIMPTMHGEILLAATEEGLYAIQPKDNGWSVQQLNELSLVQVQVDARFADKVFFATNYGVWEQAFDGRDFTPPTKLAEGNSWSGFLHIDKRGWLWSPVIDYQLAVYKPNNQGSFIHSQPKIYHDPAIVRGDYQAAVRFGQDSIFGAAFSGLLQYNEATDAITPYLASELSHIQEEHIPVRLSHKNKGELWCWVVNLADRTETLMRLYFKDGQLIGSNNQLLDILPTMVIYDIEHHPEQGSWIGGSDGIYQYNTDAYNLNLADFEHLSFNVNVEQITLHAEQTEAHFYHAPQALPPFKGAIDYARFEFAAYTYVFPEKTRFKTRLTGYEKEWSEWTEEKFKEYTNLPSGEYRFDVKAINAFNVESKVSSFTFSIEPEWPRWLIMLAMAGLLLVSILVVKMLIKMKWLNLQNRELREQVVTSSELAQHIISSQEQERKRIAADLHDSIGQNLLVLKNKAWLCAEKVKNQHTQHEQWRSFSEAVSNTLQEVRAITHMLRPFQVDHLGLSKAIRSMVESMTGAKNIKVECKIDDIDSKLDKDKEIHLYRIVQESLNNAIKHSRASLIKVHISTLDSKVIEVAIEDNGCGFTQSKDAKSGLGLLNLKERSKLIGGTIQIESLVGQGTKIKVSIPLAIER